MTGFTRQEQIFIIVILISLAAGVGVNFLPREQSQKNVKEVLVSHSGLLEEFTAAASVDSFVAITGDSGIAKVTKQQFVGKININTANSQELQTLPHIGPALAQSIIEYRSRNGSFKTIEEIKNVKRIGQKTFNKIKMNITVK